MTPSVLWFRRDLRLRDHPALDAAAQAGPVCALFVLDDVLLKVDEGPRTAYLYRSLRALDEDLRSHGGRLTVKRGRPENVVPRLAKEIGAARSTSARTSRPTAPPATAASRRPWRRAAGADRQPVCGVARPGAQEGRRPVQGLHPVLPGVVGARLAQPVDVQPGGISWHPVDGIDIPHDPRTAAELPEAGEAAALAAWKDFLAGTSSTTTRSATGPTSTARHTCRCT